MIWFLEKFLFIRLGRFSIFCISSWHKLLSYKTVKKILFFKLSITDLFINNIIQREYRECIFCRSELMTFKHVFNIHTLKFDTIYSGSQICCGCHKLKVLFVKGLSGELDTPFFIFFLVKNIAIRYIFTDFIWIFIHKFTYNFR